MWSKVPTVVAFNFICFIVEIPGFESRLAPFESSETTPSLVFSATGKV